MKRLFPTSLALLLVFASFGHVFAAVFCPRALGRECCFAKTGKHTHSPSSNHVDKTMVDMHMHEMSMDGMNMEGMAMGDTSMDHNAMDDTAIDAASVDISIAFSRVDGEVAANKFDQPVELCAHCLGHSGIVNAPISSMSVPDQSNKDLGSVPLPVARFLTRPAMTFAQIGLPGEHGPPGSTAPRYILINVFQI